MRVNILLRFTEEYLGNKKGKVILRSTRFYTLNKEKIGGFCVRLEVNGCFGSLITFYLLRNLLKQHP